MKSFNPVDLTVFLRELTKRFPIEGRGRHSISLNTETDRVEIVLMLGHRWQIIVPDDEDWADVEKMVDDIATLLQDREIRNQ